MCLHPVLIPNPNAGSASRSRLSFLHDTHSAYIPVPCGHCVQCIAVRQSAIMQRCQMMGLKYHIFFGTLTYNNKMLPHFVEDSLDIPYADFSDWQKMIKRIRKYHLIPRPFKYLVCTERGKQRARPHFHFLLFVEKRPGDDPYLLSNLEKDLFWTFRNEWRRNVGSCRKPDYVPLFSYAEKWSNGRLYRNFDLHLVQPFRSEDAESDVSFYVTKYLFKPSVKEEKLQQFLRLNLDDGDYFRIWPIVRSRVRWSRGFGLPDDPDVIRQLRYGIRSSYESGKESPSYFSPSTGKELPLARYYRRFADIYSLDDELLFYSNRETITENADCLRISDMDDISQLKVKAYQGKKRQNLVQKKSDLFDNLDF